LALAAFDKVASADDALIAAGREAYVQQCARCHGPTGNGDGPDAKRLPVSPRILTSGMFKFRTTASGTPPTDEDLLWVLNHGMSGAGMPSFANLQLDTKKAIIAYVKTLSTAFKDFKPQPINPPNEHVRVDPAKGAEIYKKLQCYQCHGMDGRGNGPSAPSLVDGWGKPIRAANLTQGWTYRAGNAPRDIYYRLMAGLNGAPMPSYDGAVTPDEAWQLANYVSSLQSKARWSTELQIKKIQGELPTDAADAKWNDALRTDVNLQSAIYKGGKRDRTNVNAVTVRALANDKMIALSLEWNDPTKSEKSPADAVLVAFKPKDFKGDPRANLYTLYQPDSAPLDLTYWDASKPGAAHQKFSSVESAIHSNWSDSKEVSAKATYNDGLWTLVLTRPLSEGATAIGFAAWDGDNGEADLKRSSSQWVLLGSGNLEEK
jgi:DMSO reductase family type II enzyme heme b subunit